MVIIYEKSGENLRFPCILRDLRDKKGKKPFLILIKERVFL